MEGDSKHLNLTLSAGIVPLHSGLQCFGTVFPYTPLIYLQPDLFFLFLSIGKMRLSQGSFTINMDKNVGSLGLALKEKKKVGTEGVRRGEKEKEKQDKKTMTLHNKMLCRELKGLGSILHKTIAKWQQNWSWTLLCRGPQKRSKRSSCYSICLPLRPSRITERL